jgi:hypothetical protein
MKFDCGLSVEWYWQDKSKLSREKACPLHHVSDMNWIFAEKIQENYV